MTAIGDQEALRECYAEPAELARKKILPALDMSTPERFCIGRPEQNYTSGISKRAPISGPSLLFA
jgi:hypothetical protein